MTYKLFLPERPFRAIKNGSKKVEGRTITNRDKTPYASLKAGDILEFYNKETGEFMNTTVLFVHHYKDVRTMLEKEGPENVLSSTPKTIEHGIESYNSFTDYKENILQYGIYAIGIMVI